MSKNKNYQEFADLVEKSKNIVVIQAENPDGDSLGSALALEAILSDMNKHVSLYCPVDIPKYLRYAKGWDRVDQDLPVDFDLSIIVDTSSSALLERAFVPDNLSRLSSRPAVVLDHHLGESDLPIKYLNINDSNSVATGELIYNIASESGWKVAPDACENLAISILSDSLGLTTEGTTHNSILTLAKLVEGGAKISEIENRRREFMKKSPEILAYKGQLLQRVEYFLGGSLAFVHIPWDEIAKYSDQYNPSMLVLDELRLVEGVKVAVALKSYPDSKITGKIRTSSEAKIAEVIAGYFGGGGHPYAAGFKVYDQDFESLKAELVGVVDKSLRELK